MEILDWICKQFQDASSVIEYISWLTASIFSVLAVFTIFLAHQFQIHTSELIKVLWKLKEVTKEFDKENSKGDFAQLLNDFKYFSKSPEVIEQSIITSRVVLNILIPIWILSGLSLSSKVGIESQTDYPVLSVILIVTITGLFIYFSLKLLDILDRLTKEGNDDIPIKTIEQLKDIKKLKDSGFQINNILQLEQLRLEIFINDEEPFASIRSLRNYGFYNFYILLTIECNRRVINIGFFIREENKQVKLEVQEKEQEELNKFFEEKNISNAQSYFTIITDGVYYTFRAELQKPTEDGELPLEVEYILGEKVNWSASRNILKRIEEFKQVISVD